MNLPITRKLSSSRAKFMTTCLTPRRQNPTCLRANSKVRSMAILIPSISLTRVKSMTVSKPLRTPSRNTKFLLPLRTRTLPLNSMLGTSSVTSNPSLTKLLSRVAANWLVLLKRKSSKTPFRRLSR